MNQALEILREKINDKAREILNLLGTVNEMEKTVSRLKSELTEMYEKLDDTLDKTS